MCLAGCMHLKPQFDGGGPLQVVEDFSSQYRGLVVAGWNLVLRRQASHWMWPGAWHWLSEQPACLLP